MNSLVAGEVVDAQLSSSFSSISFSSKTEAQFEESYSLSQVVNASSAPDLVRFIEGEEMEGGVLYYVYPSETASIGLVTTNFALSGRVPRNFSVSAMTENSVTLHVSGANPPECATSAFNVYWHSCSWILSQQVVLAALKQSGSQITLTRENTLNASGSFPFSVQNGTVSDFVFQNAVESLGQFNQFYFTCLNISGVEIEAFYLQIPFTNIN